MPLALPPPAAILLDWDGTICDSMTRLYEIQKQICVELGLPVLTQQQNHETTIHGRRGAHVALKLDDATGDRFYDLFAERFFVFDGQVTLLEGAAEFVQNIPADIPVGIVSNNRSDLLNAQIRHLGWAGRFGAVVAIDEAPKNKPAPDAALFALGILGVPPGKNVWFVGDTRGDIECAQAAGLTSILLAAAKPADCQPHHLFPDCTPLRKHFTS